MTPIHSAKPLAPEASSELLLREQFHRFSNSFQTIASLVRQCTRQAGGLDTAQMVGALEERLHALATLHRLLATGFEMRDFAGHVSAIARELVRSFGRTDAVILRIDRFWLPEAHRFRLALIVNELVTNVLKHSLCDCAAGLIEISARTNGRVVMLTVADSNRSPLDSGRLLPSPIVSGLAESIGGVADVVDQNGYAVRVVVPWDDHAPRVIEGVWSPTAALRAAPAGAPC
ncbi:MAG: HWE histidine kinase domain-containing protein [Sphingomonas sp.]|jgi:two-component sensor histidine kinase|uniref:sensor histidine kinase n=1 Tax=Sphingomonas sp. TaxID=28214 RepID=UPI003569F793